MKMKNGSAGRQRSGAGLSIHVFHLRLETQRLYKNTVSTLHPFVRKTLRLIRASTLPLLHLRQIIIHIIANESRWTQTENETLSAPMYVGQDAVSRVQDSSIRTVVIMATEKTNVVRRQTLAKHLDRETTPQKERYTTKIYSPGGISMEEMKPNGNVTWGRYVAEQILVALSFFLFFLI